MNCSTESVNERIKTQETYAVLLSDRRVKANAVTNFLPGCRPNPQSYTDHSVKLHIMYWNSNSPSYQNQQKMMGQSHPSECTCKQ